MVEPGAGELACGDYGSGRMADPDSIVAEVKLRLQVQRKRDLRGLRVMITAGGTREPIDAVRFIGNRSSGKMGFALARAAFDRGAQVDLIEANVDMPAAPGVRQIEAPTAGEMHAEVMKRLPDTDILIMAAAVADYRVADGPAGGKIGKGRDEWCIDLEATTDILCDVAAHHKGQFLVGFAAEYGLEGLEPGPRQDGAQDARHDRLQRHLAHRHRLRLRLQRGAHPHARTPRCSSSGRPRRPSPSSSWTTSPRRVRARAESAGRPLATAEGSSAGRAGRAFARLAAYRQGACAPTALKRSPSWPGSLPRP